MFFAGRVGNALVISLLMLIIVPAVGRLIYDVSIPWEHLPAVLVTLAVGAASFCCLGIALTAAIPNEDAAPAVTNVALLPLYFLSGVFIPETEIPDGVLQVADAVPDPALLRGFLRRLGPGHDGPGFEWGHLGDRRRLGSARPAAGDPLLPLDAEGRASAAPKAASETVQRVRR